MDFAEAVVLVTGGSSGIGAATAEMLAGRGSRGAINYAANQAGAEAILDACQAAGGQAMLVQGDVADDRACRDTVAAVLARWGRIDGLVNNAGITKVVQHADLEGLDAEDFQRIYAVNVIGAYQMARAVATPMRQLGDGAIVNVSSAAGVYGVGSSIAYAASKGAMNTLTLALARTLAPEIRVNAICPGWVTTAFLQQRMPSERWRQIGRDYQQKAPLRRQGEAVDIARSILFFLDGDANMTGQVVVSDSGMHLS